MKTELILVLLSHNMMQIDQSSQLMLQVNRTIAIPLTLLLIAY